MMVEGEIKVSWSGFLWVWDFPTGEWLIDIPGSGGPPSPHDESPKPPPFTVEKKA